MARSPLPYAALFVSLRAAEYASVGAKTACLALICLAGLNMLTAAAWANQDSPQSNRAIYEQGNIRNNAPNQGTQQIINNNYPPPPQKPPATITPAWQLSAPPPPSPSVPLPLQCGCLSKRVVTETPISGMLNGTWRRISGEYVYTNQCADRVVLSLSKWENSPARQYYVSAVSLDPGNSVSIRMSDVAPDPELRVTVVECPHPLNPYTGQVQPVGGGARGCLVERETFAALGKPWGRTMCVASTPGVAGRPCTCEVEGSGYPGIYVGAE